MTDYYSFQNSPEDLIENKRSSREENHQHSRRSSRGDPIRIIDNEIPETDKNSNSKAVNFLEGTFGTEEIKAQDSKQTKSGMILKKSDRSKIIDTISARYKATQQMIEENITAENFNSIRSDHTEIFTEDSAKVTKPKALMPSLKLKSQESISSATSKAEKSKAVISVEKKRNTKSNVTKPNVPGNKRLEEDQEYKTLKEFYKVVIDERKQTNSQLSKAKRQEVEDKLFKETKENVSPNSHNEEKIEAIETVSAKTKSGLIKKQVSSIDTKKYLDNLISKFKSLSSIFNIEPSDMDLLEKFKGKRSWEKDMISSAKKVFKFSELTISDYIQYSFDLIENKSLLQNMLLLNRKPLLQLISFAQNFEYIHFVREINQNKKRLKEIIYAQKELIKANFEMEEYMKNFEGPKSKISKELPTKASKRITITENEVKIAMLKDIQARLTQKNVFLSLKFFYMSKKLGESMISAMNQTYANLLLFYASTSLKYYSQLRLDKKFRNTLARARLFKFCTKSYFQGWSRYISIKKQKSKVIQQLCEWNNEKKLRRSFYSLLKKVHLNKLVSNDLSIAHKFCDFRLKLRSFLLLKHTKCYEEGIRARLKSLYSQGQNYDYHMTDKVSQNYRITFAGSIKLLKNKLNPHFNNRDLITGPLRKINTILKLGISSYSNPVHQRQPSNTIIEKEEPFYVETSTINRDGMFSNMGSGMIFNELQSNLGSFCKGNINKKMNNTLNISSANLVYESIKENIRVLYMTKLALVKSIKGDWNNGQNKFLNLQDRKKYSESRATKELMNHAFTAWKIAYIDRNIIHDVEHYQTMNFTKQLFAKYRVIIDERRKVEDELEIDFYSKKVQRIFDYLKYYKLSKDNEKNQKAENFYLKKIFDEIKSYSKKQKEKHKLHKIMAIRFRKLLFSKIFQAWEQISSENYSERHKIRSVLLKKMMKNWRTKFQKRILLKNVFGNFNSAATWYFEEYPRIIKHKVKYIFWAWRNEVIENEHTAKQKIDNMLALRKFKTATKKKYFQELCKKTAKSKSLSIMTSMFKFYFRARIWKKWHRHAQTTGYFAKRLQQRRFKNILKNAFASLKKNKEIESSIKTFKAKKFFFSWKAKNQLKTIYLPERMNAKRLMKKVIFALVAARLSKKKYHKLDFFADEHQYRKMQKIKKLVFYSLLEHQLRTKSKRTFMMNINLLRNKRTVKKCLSILKHYHYQRRIKDEKNRMASLYHQSIVRNSVRSCQSKSSDLSYPLMSLAFTAWRAFSLKRANVNHIVDRFRHFGNKKIARTFFAKWHNLYHQKTKTIHKSSDMKYGSALDLELSLSKYLPRENNRSTYKLSSHYITDHSLTYSLENNNIPDPNESFGRNQDYWIQKMKENEDFLLKITERDSEFNSKRKRTEESFY